MHTIFSKKQEVIRVIHDSRDGMRKTIAGLMEDGWSESTLKWSTWDLTDEEGVWVALNHPKAVIHPPDPKDFLRNKPYIYVSEHVRDIEEEK